MLSTRASTVRTARYFLDDESAESDIAHFERGLPGV
jgi:hypothetical protein